MREIKFRFHVGGHGMSRPFKLAEIHNTTYFVTFSDICISFNDPGLTIMQYTGLKDKNGVEIYEGDVLCIENDCYVESIGGYSRYEPDNIIAPVEFKDGGFFCDSEWLWESHGISEIIGNIYENPELGEDNG